MEQILGQSLQSKAHEMVACLEFIKLNIKTDGESGKMANGKRKLKLWKHYTWKTTRISLNIAFWIFILYTIFF
jgi:hypothetical protein